MKISLFQKELSKKQRIIIALFIGLVAGYEAYLFRIYLYPHRAGDLTWALVGAREWLSGHNPYASQALLDIYRLDPVPLFYPFTTVLFVLPLSFLPDMQAAAVFVSISFVLFTYFVLSDGLWRFPILLSLSAFFAVNHVQWTPLLACLWYFPSALPLALLKPTCGLALASRRWSLQGVIIAGVFVAVSLILFPLWPWYWLRSTQGMLHIIPLLYGPRPAPPSGAPALARTGGAPATDNVHRAAAHVLL